MAGRPSIVAAAAAIAWPLVSHGAAIAGRPEWMPAITAAVAGVIVVAAAAGTASPRVRATAAIALALVALAWWRFPLLLLYLPPVAINLVLGTYFASTLRRGQEPRIARYARLEQGGELPADLARYTRRLTWIWSVYFFVAAAVSLALAATASLATWSAFSNVLSYLVVAALFVGEYAYRKLRFPHYRHAPLGALARSVARDHRFGRATDR